MGAQTIPRPIWYKTNQLTKHTATMLAFICKQPNGKYCRFSTILETVTHINMTEDEYIAYRVGIAMQEAREE